MRFHPSYHFAWAYPSPWMWGLFLGGSSSLLSMVVQPWVVIQSRENSFSEFSRLSWRFHFPGFCASVILFVLLTHGAPLLMSVWLKVYQFCIFFSKIQLLAFLIFAMFSFHFFYFCSDLHHFFPLLTLGFACSCFSNWFRCMVKLFVWDFPCFLRYYCIGFGSLCFHFNSLGIF